MKKIILAPNESIHLDSEFIHYPMYASPKYDGHRLIILSGNMFSRNGKPQPNINLPNYLKNILDWGRKQQMVIDGELYAHNLSFNELQSMLRRKDALLVPQLRYHVFDMLTQVEWDNGTEMPFDKRYNRYAIQLIKNCLAPTLPVKQILVENSEKAASFFEQSLQDGYEGMMLRSPNGIYKHGRCTLQEGNLLKFKEWVTVDAVIIGFTQRRKMLDKVRLGVRTRNVFGSLERSHHQEDFEETEEIGCVEVELPDGTHSGVNFAKEFDDEINWKNHKKYIGKHVEIRYMKVGMKDRPRFGLITRTRPELD